MAIPTKDPFLALNSTGEYARRYGGVGGGMARFDGISHRAIVAVQSVVAMRLLVTHLPSCAAARAAARTVPE